MRRAVLTGIFIYAVATGLVVTVLLRQGPMNLKTAVGLS